MAFAGWKDTDWSRDRAADRPFLEAIAAIIAVEGDAALIAENPRGLTIV